MSSRRSRSAALGAVVALLIALFPAVGAAAATAVRADATPTPAPVPTTVTQDALPTVQVNGIVWSQVTVGTTVYAVGKFDSARPPGVAVGGAGQVPMSNILAYNITTGQLISSFSHTLNGQGLVVTASPDGSTVWVGGQFTQVDGQARYRIAAFSTATGALLSYAPGVDAGVQAISATNTTVYFGGVFSRVDGVARTRLAAYSVDPKSPGLLPWAPTANSVVNALVVSPDRSKVFVGGQYTQVDGVNCSGTSAVDPTSGSYIPTQACQAIPSAITTSSNGILSLKTDGNLIYGGSYGYTSGQFEGTFAMDQAGNIVWLNDCWGDTYDTTPIGGVLYVASHAHACTGPGFFPDSSAHHPALAYGLTPSTGYNAIDARGWNFSAYHYSSLLNWNPTFTGGTIAGQAVWSFTGTSDGSYVSAGGEFPSVNGVAQQGLVRFSTHANAPNKYGPYGLGAATATVTPTSTGAAVTVTAAYRAYDPDDSVLAYHLTRSGDSSKPIATTSIPTPNFSQQGAGPTVSLTDPSAPPDSTLTYQMVAVDGGNGKAYSSVLTVTTPPADLALKQPASQSSTFGGASADRAVDGNTDGLAQNGSESVTNNDPYSWWQVDLGSSQSIGSVVVWNSQDRPDTIARLSDYWVFASNQPFNTALTPTQQATQAGVWSSHQTSAPNPSQKILTAAATKGRYVMVQLGTANQYLNLAEVQVFGLSKGYLAVSPSTLDAGTVAVNSTATRTFTLSNPGSTAITLSAVTQPGGPFTISPAISVGQSLAASKSITETVTYAPTAEGNYSGSLSITGSDGQGAKTVALTGSTPNPPAVNLAKGKAVSTSSSLESGPWGAANLTDGVETSTATANGWTSVNSLSSDHTEWAQVDLGSAQTFAEVDLFPRADAGNVGQGFPVNLTIATSTDGNTWTTQATKTNAPLPSGVQRFPFQAVTARYVRVTGTSLRPNPNDGNQYRMQLTELEVVNPGNAVAPAKTTLSASSSFEGFGWSLANVNDGSSATGWSSNNSTTTNHTEWVQFDRGAASSVSEVDLTPRTDAGNVGQGYPVNFTIATSNDGTTWTTQVTTTNAPLPSATQAYTFPTVSARYVRVTGTSLRPIPNDSNQYRMQFCEVAVK